MPLGLNGKLRHTCHYTILNNNNKCFGRWTLEAGQDKVVLVAGTILTIRLSFNRIEVIQVEELESEPDGR